MQNHTSDGLAQLQLATQLALPEVHRRNMTLAPGEQQLPPIPRVIAMIWAQALQFQLEPLLRRLHGRLAGHVVLADAVGALELGLGLEEPGGILEEDLGILGLCDRGLILGFHLLHAGAQLFVAHAAHVDTLAAAIVAVGLLLAPPPLLLFAGEEGCAGVVDLEGAVGLRLSCGGGIAVHCRARGRMCCRFVG